MSRQQLIDLFAKVEKEYPVAEWTQEGIQVWPVLKKNIFFKWLDENTESELAKHTVDKKTSKKARYAAILGSFLNVLKISAKPFCKIDTLFAGAYNYRVDLNGEFVNRYYYPISRDNKKYINFEFNKKVDGKVYDTTLPNLFLNDIFPFFNFVRKLKNISPVKLKGWQEVVKVFRDTMAFDISTSDLRFQSILAMVDAYRFLLKKYRPEKIYELCYYKNEMFALNVAAKELGIETCDIQHGGQGSLHSMYTFQNFPEGGYNTLPQKFWVWDRASANHINSWIKPPHQVEIKGNPWIDYQIANGFESTIDTNKKIILYTLQDLTLDPYIVEAIEKTPSEYQWWLRLHPRKLEYKQELIAQLHNATGKYEIEGAVKYSLPQLLSSSIVHLSKYSGSIIEAALVRTPTIIIHPIGVDTFSNYIESGDAVGLDSYNADDLLNLIFKLENKEH